MVHFHPKSQKQFFGCFATFHALLISEFTGFARFRTKNSSDSEVNVMLNIVEFFIYLLYFSRACAQIFNYYEGRTVFCNKVAFCGFCGCIKGVEKLWRQSLMIKIDVRIFWGCQMLRKYYDKHTRKNRFS